MPDEVFKIKTKNFSFNPLSNSISFLFSFPALHFKHRLKYLLFMLLLSVWIHIYHAIAVCIIRNCLAAFVSFLRYKMMNLFHFALYFVFFWVKTEATRMYSKKIQLFIICMPLPLVLLIFFIFFGIIFLAVLWLYQCAYECVSLQNERDSIKI